MGRILALLIAAFTASPVVFGAHDPNQPTSPRPAAQLVRMEPNEPADRGALPIGQLASRRVTLKNVSDKRVDLRVARVSCPCVDTVLGAKTLVAGEETELTIGTTVTETNGKQIHFAEVEAVARDSAGLPVEKQTFQVQIAYVPDVQAVVRPEWLPMWAVSGERDSFRLLTLRLDGHAPEIEAVELPGPWVRVAAVQPARERRALSEIVIEPATERPGFYSGWAKVRVRGDEEAQHHTWIGLRIREPLAVEPAGIVVRTGGDADASSSYTINLLPWTGSQAVRRPSSLRLAAPVPGITLSEVQASEPGEARWSFAVTIDSGALAAQGQHGRAEIQVASDRGDVLATVPVVWFTGEALRPD